MATRAIEKVGRTFLVEDVRRNDWDWYESDDWEPDTAAVFRRFLRPDTRFVDLGAWIGFTVFLAAPFVARIVCAEPDPVAFAELTRNLELNPDVAAKTAVLPVAAGPRDAAVTMSAPTDAGTSHSSVVRAGDAGAHWEVEQVCMPTLLARAGLNGVDFVKIDVEAAEYELVPAMCAQLAERPTLYVAMHPNLLLDKRSLRRRLTSSVRALRANRRFLRAVLVYRHHYAYENGRLRDVRRRNLVRVLFPLPVRGSFLVGAFVFTDEDVVERH
jgi:FkbM family methyltransferase